MKELANKRILIKLGGSVLEDEKVMKNLCIDIKNLKEAGAEIIIVHGGGKFITKCLEKHNVQTKFLDGLRVTPKEHMEIIQMALYRVNKKLSQVFSSINLDGISISGEDSNLITCSLIDKDKYGYVGLVKDVDPTVILKSLPQGVIPIVATICLTDKFESVNVNADNVASELAIICDVDELIYITDQNGVLDNNGNLIKSLSVKDISKLIESKTAIGGMSIKLDSIKNFLNCSKKTISILNGNQEKILTKKILFNAEELGTTCVFGGGI
ncbi:acetylglutamate kinase [Francisella sp. XLW-1]|uniref:acetylglutamate kinase n=1 Tax=Francisella sp. XLW-1 TaxID=2610887 RepID=UPI00123D2573|nr:acetylglutamate kinase [Francisella sp. XLW-1]